MERSGGGGGGMYGRGRGRGSGGGRERERREEKGVRLRKIEEDREVAALREWDERMRNSSEQSIKDFFNQSHLYSERIGWFQLCFSPE
jgi:hypothetical protein